MLYAQAISGSQGAARFLSPDKPSAAADIAVSIMEKKLKAYLNFNQTYPGFGGLLPWFNANEQELSPTADWVDRIPALDNGCVALHIRKKNSRLITYMISIVSYYGLSMVQSRHSKRARKSHIGISASSGQNGLTTQKRPLQR